MSSMHNADSFSINNNLQVVRKKIIPFQGKLKVIKEINNLILRRTIEKLEKKYCFDTIIITNPNDLEILSDSLINNKNLIYDCMDNYKKFPGSDELKLIKNETKLLKLSDNIIVSSDDLLKELMKYNLETMNNIKVVNNGVDIEKFKANIHKGNVVADIFKNDEKQKICYVGTISDWVDLDLISEVAKKYNDVNFYFIGPIDKNLDIEIYRSYQNIIFTGVQPYQSIPEILNSVDIAIMPFILNDLVMSVNPVKIYEYLAMGKPVIATRYSETEKFGNLINLYSTLSEFDNIIINLLNEEDKDLQQKRVDYAKNNSWASRVKDFEECL